MRVGALLLLVACGGSSASPPDAAVDAVDAAIDTAGGLPATCDGPCRTTSLTAALAATRTLDHAVYGVTTTAAGATLHVEAYGGGAAGCPTSSSPTPDYTLVLGSVPIPASTAPSTSPGNILDFVGDLLGGPLGAAATTVTITPAALGADFVALDLSLVFDAGTISGHLFAAHCDSLDSSE